MPPAVTDIATAIAQAVAAHAASQGLPSVPGGFADGIIAEVTNALTALPGRQRMPAGRHILPAMVAASFGNALDKLSPVQRQALRLGLDPCNPLIVARLAEANGLTGRREAGDEIDGGQDRTRHTGRRFAGLPAADAPCTEGGRRFAALGFSGETMDTLGTLGIDRRFIERLLFQGYDRFHLAGVARDAQALGVQGEQAFGIAAAAPTDLRQAAAAIANARTAAERAAAEKHYRELAEQYQRLPEDDPRRQAALEFIRLKQRLDEAAAHRAAIGNQATLGTSTEVVTPSGSNSHHARADADRADRAAKQKPTSVVARQMVDDFGVAPQASPPERRPPTSRPQTGV